jgi:predicted component of type VI protein secretion system
MDANLVLLKKSGSHKAFSLTRNMTVLGRRDDCDLRIPLPMVSRRHCAISLNKDSLLLRDLGSRGGTFVNDQRVDDQTTVKPGDYIRIGPLIFVCQIDGKPEKIVPPPAPQAKPKPQPPKAPKAADASGSKAEEDFSDLDVSGSSINLDKSDSDLEDLKNV